MNRNELSIATISWARDEAEESLLRASLQQLARLNIPVFITDGGSRPSFLEFLHGIPHFTLLQAAEKGVWAQARSSMREALASGTPWIFYTEPDKLGFIQQSLPALIEKVTPDEKSGLVLVSRSPAAFATFPSFQQMTETAINGCCAELTGIQADHTYGPFFVNRSLLPYLEKVREDIGWGWRPFLFGLAKRLALTVESLPGDFFCPEDQRTDRPQERVYRMKQLEQNIRGLILSTTIRIKNDPLNLRPA